MKENGSTARQEDKLSFKVIEFSKENRRIVVSHSRLNEDKLNKAKSAERAEMGKEEASTNEAIKKIKDSQEKSTLGDMNVLSALKSSLETTEREAAIARLESKSGKAEELPLSINNDVPATGQSAPSEEPEQPVAETKPKKGRPKKKAEASAEEKKDE
jgi:small subunit ribosomal protein S1